MAFNLFSKRTASLAVLTAVTLSLAACGSGTSTTAESPEAGATAESPAAGNLSGSILADGSSTVFPITEAMAEEFMAKNPGVQVTVGTSGTGGGFEKFCNNETQISNASRGIKDEEKEKCAAAGVEFVEIPVATDALTVVVNPENDWASCLTIEELATIWGPDAQGKVSNWNQVRSSFPDAPLALYGPGTDSGTFDYFTDTVNGEEGDSRGDYTASEDDNVLVQGVEGDKNALGYFGYAYYAENQDKLKAVEIDGGEGCVAPNEEDVLNGTYKPLSRPLFVYVNKAALAKPEFKAFVDFITDPANKQFVSETGYVPLSDEQYTEAKGLVSQ
ncbi:PstS family phosphate ABC transporter substrate-binding protein [Leptolyngbya sp. PL-A3]|uniref:PstS family phosphate ABC transporter substrate-binding protein n=1 Tax=Leptolyngbya sp. PL-A3 TaxID=2933911 RepID=UPI0032967CD9